jgi:flagellar motor switch protein FliN
MKQEKSTAQRARLIEAWASELGRVLAETSGSRPSVSQVPFDVNETRADMVWWRASGDPAVCIGVREHDARMLQPDFSDLLNRSWGPGEITAAPGGVEDTNNAEGWDVRAVRFATGEEVRFFVAPEIAVAPPAANLEILMDIELPIVIRFGHTEMALRDIARLSAGSVIEFDRGIDEPVQVMINGHVVAWGEVVTVKGSYGVRISEIASRPDRLLTSSFAMQRQAV